MDQLGVKEHFCFLQIQWQGFLMEDEEEEDNVCGGLSELESVGITDMPATCCSAICQDHFCEAGRSLVIDIRGRLGFTVFSFLSLFMDSFILGNFFYPTCMYFSFSLLMNENWNQQKYP